jgi:hypothetical protein
MRLRSRRPTTDHGVRVTTRLGAAAAAVAICSVALVGCSKDDTTTVEPATTEAPVGSTSSIATSKEGVDAIVEMWVQLGFSEDQARCLVEQMNEMSGDISSTDASSLTPSDQNLIEQMMKDCKIDDDSLKAQLGG